MPQREILVSSLEHLLTAPTPPLVTHTRARAYPPTGRFKRRDVNYVPFSIVDETIEAFEGSELRPRDLADTVAQNEEAGFYLFEHTLGTVRPSGVWAGGWVGGGVVLGVGGGRPFWAVVIEVLLAGADVLREPLRRR